MGNYPSDKCEELYKKAKPTKEKRDKSRIDYEFDKNSKECTFKPNIVIS
jgi:hypothetical protein